MVSVPLWAPESDFHNPEAWVLIEFHAALIPIVLIHPSGMTLIVEGYFYSRSCKKSQTYGKGRGLRGVDLQIGIGVYRQRRGAFDKDRRQGGRVECTS